MALSELNGIATERQHWRKAEAATELHTRGILSTDLSPILELLNQARKDAGYEGEDPDFGDWTSESLLSIVEDAVQTAEQATHTVPDDDEDGEGEGEADTPPATITSSGRCASGASCTTPDPAGREPPYRGERPHAVR